MPDLGAIAGLIGSVNALREMVQGLSAARDAFQSQEQRREFLDATIAIQGHALTAQAEQSAMLNRIRELEHRVAEFESWSAEAQRYALRDHGGGAFAYVLKDSEALGEPTHKICPACYQRSKSILQFSHKDSSGQERYDCPACKTMFMLGLRRSSGRQHW